MSFGGMFDGAGSGIFSYEAGGGAGMHNPGRLIPTPPIPKPAGFAAPGLSLGLTNMDGGQLGDMSRLGLMGSGGSGSGGDGDSLGRGREDENDSRSGSDNMDGASGDELDPDNSNPRKKKKRYHRHTPQQIQELEAVFKECPHPDEKQRMELSKRLNLESRQVKFWFQNRRTQMKTQIERYENALLRQENDKLRAENMTIREAMRSPICSNCGGAAMLGEVSLEEQHLRIENARLKDEFDRVCALAGKFLGRPISSASPPSLQGCSGLELGVGTNDFGLGSLGASVLQPIPDLMGAGLHGSVGSAAMRLPAGIGSLDGAMHGAAEGVDRTVLLELGLTAMEELVKVAQMDEPLWLPRPDGSGFETLNFDEYHRAFARVFGPSPAGYVSEATREVGIAITSSVDLVDSLMDAARWSEMFPCIVARASTTDIISSGMGGTRSGSIQLMHAELQVLSPLVPIREVVFLRFCKQHAEGLWAVVDVSVDSVLRPDGHHHHHHAQNGGCGAAGYMGCRLLPTGCIVQDMNNGYSKVTWVIHAEYDETAVHQLYRPLLRSGQALGARRWLASLQRQCQYIAILCSNSFPARDHAAITPVGRRSMLKLAQRMTDNFCAGVCASAAQKWRRLDEWRGGEGGGGPGCGAAGEGEEKVRMMARQSVGAPGEPPGVVLSATTSVRLPATPPQRVFDYLRDEQRRGEWDILANGEAMQEMDHIAKGQHHGNAVSLLRPNATSGNQNNMLILQETCTDSSGSLVVYAPVDVQSMHVVMNGGDSAYVSLLPSGFAILPDGHGAPSNPAQGSSPNAPSTGGNTGSLVTVAFQILVNNLPTAKLTVESVDTVSNLLSCTIQKIKSALQASTISP
ncbi:homeobox-leucine zipper protein ROC6-like isoform X2 [Phragmites australis]|uniref:homeobox-leucine zipper protein ROC6-like isoform X2 n=1 Tax=Phragmites australis TaxID=29695 RepID=UPI002D794B13|nr:homeobox-leucine zipper protein ROC6-like isoform X2 [Phragmites australis]